MNRSFLFQMFKLMFIGQSTRLVILSERSESKDLGTEYLHRRINNA